MTCPNCNTKLSCSCKVRKATDGKQVCTSCITAYEEQLRKLKFIKK
jgi:transcription elongation factor Elf1